MKLRRSIFFLALLFLFLAALSNPLSARDFPPEENGAGPSPIGEEDEWTGEALLFLRGQGLVRDSELQNPELAVKLALVRAAERVRRGEKLSAPLQAVLFRLLLSYADSLAYRLPQESNAMDDKVPQPTEKEDGMLGIELEGYLDYRFISGAREKGSTLSLPRLTLEIEGMATPRDDLYIELEWEDGGIEGGEDGGAVEIERARIDHTLSRNWKLRAGALIIPVGHIGMHHEPYDLVGVSRPLIAKQLIPTAWTELGAGLVGRPLPKLRLIGLVSQGLEANISHQGLREARPGLGEEKFSGKATTLNLQLEPSRGLTVGGSWYQTSFAQGGRLDHLSAYLQWEKHGYRILAELARANLSSDNPDLPSWMGGWYLQGELPLPSLAWRQGTIPKLFARLGRVDTSSDPSLGRKRRLTLGLNFPLDQNLTLKLEAQRTWDQAQPSPQNRFLASLVMIF